MFTESFIKSPTIQPSTNKHGRFFIKVSDVQFRFFSTEAQAQAWLALHVANLAA